MILLTDEEIINLVTDYHFSGEQNRHILAKNVAKAQLEKVAKHIEGELVQYSVIDGRLSKYIEGTTPLWALPNLLRQALLEEVKE